MANNSSNLTNDDYMKFLEEEMSAANDRYAGLSQEYEGIEARKKQQSIADALAGYDLMLKYLPQYNKVMGLHGLGISESGYLEAAANRDKLLTEAQLQYDANTLKYNQQMESDRLKRLDELANMKASYLSALEQREYDDAKAKEKADQDEAYETYSSLWNALSTAESVEDYKALMEIAENSLPDYYYNKLKTNTGYFGNKLQKAEDEAAAEEEATKTASENYKAAIDDLITKSKESGAKYLRNRTGKQDFSDGDQFSITWGSLGAVPAEVKGTVDEYSDDYDVLKYMADNLGIGAVFAYNNKIYMYSPRGDIVELIPSSTSAHDAEKFNYFRNQLFYGNGTTSKSTTSTESTTSPNQQKTMSGRSHETNSTESTTSKRKHR